MGRSLSAGPPLSGTDPFEGIAIEPEAVRLQAEREAKAKALLLRRAYVETGGRHGGLLAYLQGVGPAIDAILKDSAVDPVIIVMGDHGPGLLPEVVVVNHRLKILYALHLPQETLPVAILADFTPVNTFRLVFSEFFGADIPQLEDRSYISPSDDVWLLTEFEEECPE